MSPSRANVVLLWGDNEYLLREGALEAVTAAGIRGTEVDAAEWQGPELSDLATPSLWGDQRALVVTRVNVLNERALAELRGYVRSPAPDALLLLTWITRGKGPPAFAKDVTAGGGDVRQVALRRQDLPRWLVDRARSREMRLTPAGANALVGVVGEDPAVLDRSLEQLRTAFPSAALGPDQVRAQFEGAGERRVWDLCDQAFAGRAGAALHTLQALMGGREEASLPVLGGIASRVRDLIRVRALAPTASPAAAAARAGVRYDWQLRRYREQAGRYTLRELERLHEAVVEADRQIKGGVPGSVVLPALVTAIARDASAALDVDIRVSR